MDDLPYEMLIEISLKLSYDEIMKLSQTSPKYLYLLNDTKFWEAKAKFDFGNSLPVVEPPHKRYLTLVNENSKLITPPIIKQIDRLNFLASHWNFSFGMDSDSWLDDDLIYEPIENNLAGNPNYYQNLIKSTNSDIIGNQIIKMMETPLITSPYLVITQHNS